MISNIDVTVERKEPLYIVGAIVNWYYPYGKHYGGPQKIKNRALNSCDSVVKEFACNVGDTGGMSSIPGLGRSPGEGNGNPLQYSYLGNPVDRGASWAI